LNHHRTDASNGPTENSNFCVKQVKQAETGFTNFEHYKLRVLLQPVESPGRSPSSHRQSSHALHIETGEPTKSAGVTTPILVERVADVVELAVELIGGIGEGVAGGAPHPPAW